MNAPTVLVLGADGRFGQAAVQASQMPAGACWRRLGGRMPAQLTCPSQDLI